MLGPEKGQRVHAHYMQPESRHTGRRSSLPSLTPLCRAAFRWSSVQNPQPFICEIRILASSVSVFSKAGLVNRFAHCEESCMGCRRFFLKVGIREGQIFGG